MIFCCVDDDDDDVLLLPNSPSHDIWKRNLTILRKGQTIKLIYVYINQVLLAWPESIRWLATSCCHA
jgi:hypothetical protein